MSDNLGTILAGFNGVVAVVGNTVGLVSPVGREIGAGFQIINGVIVAAIGSTENTSADDTAKLEAAAVGLLVDIVTGAVVAVAVPALGGSAIVAIGAAGVVAVLTQARGDDIYAGYQRAKDKAFGIMAGTGTDPMDAIRDQFRRGEKWDTPIVLDLDGMPWGDAGKLCKLFSCNCQ